MAKGWDGVEIAAGCDVPEADEVGERRRRSAARGGGVEGASAVGGRRQVGRGSGLGSPFAV